LTGDCLEQLKRLGDASVDLIVTSPPYADARKSTYGGIHPDDYVGWFLPRSDQFLRVLKDTGSFILNIKEKVVDGERHTYVLKLILALQEQGWFWVEEYVWHKKNPIPGKWLNRFRDGWERLLHFTKQRSRFKMNQDSVRVPIGDWQQKRKPPRQTADSGRRERTNGSGFGTKDSYWIDKETVLPSNVLWLPTQGNHNHSAAFPEALPEFFVKLFTDEGDLVLDPFAGSGTTLAVAKRLNRRYIGVEKLPEYIPVIENRLEKTAALETAEPWRTRTANTASANFCLHGIVVPEARPAYEEFRERMLALAATELAA
jgi:DNA modification methylase